MERPRTQKRVQTSPFGPSMTKQSDAESADVNNIVAQFIRGVTPPGLTIHEGTFADVSNVGDYLSCVNTVKQAEAAFAELPARLRDRFGNDPSNLIEALFDPNMAAELTELGVLAPATEAPTPEVPPTPAKETPTS